MLGFFRRKKPDGSERRLSVEELAAAFPGAQQPDAPGVAADDDAATSVVETESALRPATQPDAPVDADPPVPPPSDAPALEFTAFGTPVHEAATPVVSPVPPTPPGVAIEHAESASTRAVNAFLGRAPAAASAPAAVAHSDASASQTPLVDASATAPASANVSAPEPFTPAPPAAQGDNADLDSGSTAPAAAAGRRGWLDRLRGNALTRSITGLFARNPKLDDDLLDEIETALITADVGVTATTELVERLRRRMKAREFADANALLAALRADLLAMLEPVAKPLVIDRGVRPFVILTIGVNGVGKTTTIGKLARRFRDEGRTLMLAAGDTFRAAAVAQLQAWGERNGVQVVAQGQNADAASVAFDALQAAKARGTEVLIADTAGRLHTQQGLMAELGKIRRVIQKLDAAAPHEVLLVIDGTTGQNALSQLRQFHAAVGVTGLVVTKLDGTAKGGVVFALAREFGIPIRFAGIGERPEDLRVFDAAAFVDALLPESLGGG
ncbi:signal recognition particle-docking protein FtsY [Lysobacter humi (ex Lee et al. 2017)]